MARDCPNGDPAEQRAKGVKMRPWFAINILLTIELAKTLPVFTKLDVYDQVRDVEAAVSSQVPVLSGSFARPHRPFEHDADGGFLFPAGRRLYDHASRRSGADQVEDFVSRQDFSLPGTLCSKTAFTQQLTAANSRKSMQWPSALISKICKGMRAGRESFLLALPPVANVTLVELCLGEVTIPNAAKHIPNWRPAISWSYVLFGFFGDARV